MSSDIDLETETDIHAAYQDRYGHPHHYCYRGESCESKKKSSQKEIARKGNSARRKKMRRPKKALTFHHLIFMVLDTPVRADAGSTGDMHQSFRKTVKANSPMTSLEGTHGT